MPEILLQPRCRQTKVELACVCVTRQLTEEAVARLIVNLILVF